MALPFAGMANAMRTGSQHWLGQRLRAPLSKLNLSVLADLESKVMQASVSNWGLVEVKGMRIDKLIQKEH